MVTAPISNAILTSLGAQASCLPASRIRLPREQAGCLRSHRTSGPDHMCGTGFRVSEERTA
jgi:hypothetical protein